MWAALARTRAILASAAATALGEVETWAGARLPAARCPAAEPGALLRTKPAEAPGAPRRLGALGVVRAEPGVDREETLADLAQCRR